ncbi:hypothetical protein [Nocardia harenae]|uniref:hypothetical protein n=1 Tax=Nocardia harenae TaxID=358707 RepID=UPI0008360C10|nr:hypothetical protein [Nocardia harenae]
MHRNPLFDRDELGDPRPPLPRRTPTAHRAPAPAATSDAALRAADAVAAWARTPDPRGEGSDTWWTKAVAEPEPRQRPA